MDKLCEELAEALRKNRRYSWWSDEIRHYCWCVREIDNPQFTPADEHEVSCQAARAAWQRFVDEAE